MLPKKSEGNVGSCRGRMRTYSGAQRTPQRPWRPFDTEREANYPNKAVHGYWRYGPQGQGGDFQYR